MKSKQREQTSESFGGRFADFGARMISAVLPHNVAVNWRSIVCQTENRLLIEFWRKEKTKSNKEKKRG
jgi:hypothetical protein